MYMYHYNMYTKYAWCSFTVGMPHYIWDFVISRQVSTCIYWLSATPSYYANSNFANCHFVCKIQKGFGPQIFSVYSI